MNCIKCNQEISAGTKFCPYCGAEQTVMPETGTVNTQSELNEYDAAGHQGFDAQAVNTIQPEVNTQSAEAAQNSAPIQTESNTQYQESAYTGNQGAYSYGSGYQNNAYQNGYQSDNYQNTPPYQQNQGDTVNWVPYLVVSIISTLCCCLPFGIVAIVFSTKINGAVTAGDIEEAKKAAKTAKIWIIAAVVAGIVASTVYLILSAMIGVGSYYYY